MKRAPLLFLLLFAGIFTGYFYGSILIQPNDYLFGAENDGLKNYFTYAYHIRHDPGYIEFTGMNYPYGEHFLYTDCTPVIANLVKWLGKTWPSIIPYSIGILNFCLIAAVFCCFFVVYELLQSHKINAWLAMGMAIIITLLSPQIFRLESHYALSFSLAIPLSWLLYRKVKQSNRFYLWGTFLFLNNLFWLFIHAYLGVIILFFLIALFCLDWWFLKKQLPAKAFLLSSLMLPLALFYTFVALTDQHAGRTNNPGGFFLYRAEPDDVLLPHDGPVRSLLDAILGPDLIGQKWEAQSYVGFPTTLFLVGILIWLIWNWRRRKELSVFQALQNNPVNTAFGASFIVLLFAFGIPFVQFPDLLDSFPLFKQFRAIGRFTWPFYFVSLVWVTYLVNEWIRKKAFVKNKVILLLLVGIIYLAEALPYHQEVATNITRAKNTFTYQWLPEFYKKGLQQFAADDYQAILPIPFYYFGSESFWRPRQHPPVEASILFSYYSGLPIIAAALTRTSIPESKKIVELMSPDFYPKAIQQDLSSDLPILIVRAKGEISNYEKELIDKAEIFWENPSLTLYTLSIEKLFDNSAPERLEHFKKMQSSLVEKNKFLVTDSTNLLYWNSFENQESPVAFRGKGAFRAKKKGVNTITLFQPHTFEKDTTYHLSLWMYNGEPDALNHYFQLIIEERLPDPLPSLKTVLFPEQAETISGDWSLVEGTFQVKNPENTVLLTTWGNQLSKATITADDLLIREADRVVYQYDTIRKVLFWNNHQIDLSSQ